MGRGLIPHPCMLILVGGRGFCTRETQDTTRKAFNPKPPVPNPPLSALLAAHGELDALVLGSRV